MSLPRQERFRSEVDRQRKYKQGQQKTFQDDWISPISWHSDSTGYYDQESCENRTLHNILTESRDFEDSEQELSIFQTVDDNMNYKPYQKAKNVSKKLALQYEGYENHANEHTSRSRYSTGTMSNSVYDVPQYPPRPPRYSMGDTNERQHTSLPKPISGTLDLVNDHFNKPVSPRTRSRSNDNVEISNNYNPDSPRTRSKSKDNIWENSDEHDRPPLISPTTRTPTPRSPRQQVLKLAEHSQNHNPGRKVSDIVGAINARRRPSPESVNWSERSSSPGPGNGNWILKKTQSPNILSTHSGFTPRRKYSRQELDDVDLGDATSTYQGYRKSPNNSKDSSLDSVQSRAGIGKSQVVDQGDRSRTSGQFNQGHAYEHLDLHQGTLFGSETREKEYGSHEGDYEELPEPRSSTSSTWHDEGNDSVGPEDDTASQSSTSSTWHEGNDSVGPEDDTASQRSFPDEESDVFRKTSTMSQLSAANTTNYELTVATQDDDEPENDSENDTCGNFYIIAAKWIVAILIAIMVLACVTANKICLLVIGREYSIPNTIVPTRNSTSGSNGNKDAKRESIVIMLTIILMVPQAISLLAAMWGKRKSQPWPRKSAVLWVKNKKRWSQVMYMSYVLDYKQRLLKVGDDETFILTTDADVHFTHESMEALIDYMVQDNRIGAVCGRTHPMGNGPLVWYQIFDYAVGHWFMKVANHVFGSVLCCPGCFSLYRCKAVRDVLQEYATNVNEAFEFLTKDMGEDRWFCTLMVEAGWRLAYCAAAEDSTYCPQEFEEFYKKTKVDAIDFSKSVVVDQSEIALGEIPRVGEIVVRIDPEMMTARVKKARLWDPEIWKVIRSNLSSVWHRQDSQDDPKKPVEGDEGSSSRHENSGKSIIAITVANYGPVDYNEDRAATSTSVDDLSADISPDTTVEEWLMCMPDLKKLYQTLQRDLEAIGIDLRGHRNKLKRIITKLPKRDIEEGIPTDVKQWLVELGLGEYWPYFLNNSYTEPNDLEDLKRINKEQLKTDFKVRKVAHINMFCHAIKKLQYANKDEFGCNLDYTMQQNDGVSVKTVLLLGLVLSACVTAEARSEILSANKNCNIGKQVGVCRGYFHRYYYNTITGKCEKFIYGGCGANANNFVCQKDCEKACISIAPTVYPPINPICNLPKQVGYGAGNLPRYYFNPYTRNCELFCYGGCGGNANNFVHIGQCLYECLGIVNNNSNGAIHHPMNDKCPAPHKKPKTCHIYRRYKTALRYGWDTSPLNISDVVQYIVSITSIHVMGTLCNHVTNGLSVSLTVAVPEKCLTVAHPKKKCKLPKAVVPCGRFYYDIDEGQCGQFNFGECAGNANVFRSLNECEKKCKGIREDIASTYLPWVPEAEWVPMGPRVGRAVTISCPCREV
ncbi:hypothetical protein QZH41_005874 [Actinostola sp. cb2023]|nr:hypothetical protein QZH41_005874 [Actinostola sp. cb2023]